MSHIPFARARAHQHRAGGFGNPNLLPPIGTDTTVDTTASFTLLSQSTTSSSSTTTSQSTTSSSTTSSTSSTTSSTSSTTSTTSSTTSTTSTTTSAPPSTTYTASAMHGALTITHTASVSDVGLAVTASATPTPSGAMVAPIIGGVAGGILFIAILVFAVTYFMRRRSRDDEAINFDPGVFRRSAMLLSDPPTHEDTVNRGFNPPPMMEQRNRYLGQQNYDPGYDNYDVGSPNVTSPSSGNPLVFEAPFSPITSPGVASPVGAYDQGWGAPAPVLTRNISAGSAHSAHSMRGNGAQYPALPTSRNSLPVQNPENEYLDLTRSSVTPFQAAQYADISQRLNTEVPKGLDSPTVNKYVETTRQSLENGLPEPPTPKNPFADVHIDDDEPVDMEFPAPPSPARTNSLRNRVPSMPPTLPEIVVHSRGDSISPDGTPVGAVFPSGQTVFMQSGVTDSPMGTQFPVTPSPMASSFAVNSPPAEQTGFPAVPEPAAGSQARPDAKTRQNVYSTVYDPEDAYGGM